MTDELNEALATATPETIVEATPERLAIQMRQDVGTIREVNRRQRNEFSGYKDTKGGMGLTQVARIPIVILEQIRAIHGLSWWSADWATKQKILGIIMRDYSDCMTVPGNPFGRKPK